MVGADSCSVAQILCVSFFLSRALFLDAECCSEGLTNFVSQHLAVWFLGVQALWKGMNGEPVQHLGGLRPYSEPLFRPPLLGDERDPTFSSCTVPLVLYKSHDTNFGHVTISTLPQIYSFYKEGAVNQDVTYLVRPRTS